MQNTDVVLFSHPDAAWLPEDGRADVVLAGAHSVPPDPTCVVRLLVTHGGKVLTVDRADGKGLDIPTMAVRDEAVSKTLQALTVQVLGSAQPAKFLGYVRNVVVEAPNDYPWPVPHAHFAVWHVALFQGCDLPGVWLDVSAARAQLGERHWWPLAARTLRAPSGR